MTPSQMVRRAVTPLPECCDFNIDMAPTTYDYALSADISLFDCLNADKCPICGEKVLSSTIFNMATTFCYCKNRAHMFEVDINTSKVERIRA